jgi:predicted AAA+ superfamily ATPase
MLQRTLPLWIQNNPLSLQKTFDDSDPMIWITGPRQVGKTFLAKSLVDSYYNWDTIEVRKAFAKDPYFFREQSYPKWICFDEIHKRKDWKKLIKGYYDSPERRENFLVTGSGRLDQYMRGGDSLQGRYNTYQLFPLHPDELSGTKKKLNVDFSFDNFEPNEKSASDDDLINLGGFPAPFLSGSRSRLFRWQDQYIDRLTREDIRDFSSVEKTDQIELLARILPSRTMSPLSIKSLSEDVEVSPVAIKSWLRLFEVLYLGFQMKPFHQKIHRAIKKEKKWYFYQWTFNEDPAARFENYLAVQLASCCSAWSEQGLGRFEVSYIRDQDRREVDFIITRNLKPMALFEAKSSYQEWPNSLRYYCEKLKIPGFLVYPKGPTRKHNLGWSLSSHQLLMGTMASRF